MSIIFEHIPYYREIFGIPGFRKEPFLMIGIPRVEGVFIPKDFDYKDLVEQLKDQGINDISSLDLFDPEADLKLDLNGPVPKRYENKFRVVFDMGTLEHVFDTKSCLENYFRMLKKGGLLVLITTVNGYFGHGIHVFNPEAIREVLTLNGFKVVYLKYTTSTGIEIPEVDEKKNALIWIAAKKIKNTGEFVKPQQEIWRKKYKKGQKRGNGTFSQKAKFLYKYSKRSFYKLLPKNFRIWLYKKL